MAGEAIKGFLKPTVGKIASAVLFFPLSTLSIAFTSNPSYLWLTAPHIAYWFSFKLKVNEPFMGGVVDSSIFFLLFLAFCYYYLLTCLIVYLFQKIRSRFKKEPKI